VGKGRGGEGRGRGGGSKKYELPEIKQTQDRKPNLIYLGEKRWGERWEVEENKEVAARAGLDNCLFPQDSGLIKLEKGKVKKKKKNHTVKMVNQGDSGGGKKNLQKDR